jgi:hypothetical protein
MRNLKLLRRDVQWTLSAECDNRVPTQPDIFEDVEDSICSGQANEDPSLSQRVEAATEAAASTAESNPLIEDNTCFLCGQNLLLFSEPEQLDHVSKCMVASEETQWKTEQVTDDSDTLPLPVNESLIQHLDDESMHVCDTDAEVELLS